MKGDRKVIESFNTVLTGELTAINQYFLHAEICKDWGYEKLYQPIRNQSIQAMYRAEKLIERILFLEGQPNMSRYFKIQIGKNVKEHLESDLRMEMESLPKMEEGIQITRNAGDENSRRLLKQMIKEKEDYIEWLEAQLGQMKEMGVEKYLSQQI